MNNWTELILNTVFPNEKSIEYEKRLKALYQITFSILKPEDSEKVTVEIIECEKLMAEDTKIAVRAFLNPTPENVIQEFSALAFECAQIMEETGKPILLAGYQLRIFQQLCGEDGILDDNLKKRYAKIISETVMDFAYACGDTDCTSIRMHTLMMRPGKQ